MNNLSFPSVPVLEYVHLQRFVDAYAQVSPVVLQGAVAANLLCYWEPTALRARAGSTVFTVNVRREAFDFERWRVEQERNSAQAQVMMNLQELPLTAVLDEVFAPSLGTQSRDIAITGADCRTLGKLYLSHDLCPQASQLGCRQAHLWVAGPRRRHQAHVDPGDVFIVMVCGLKRFVLAPPVATPALYPYPSHPALSRIPDLLNADIAKWPLFDPTVIQTTELRPGEVLYIPRYWWHQSDYLAPSLSLSMWSK